MHYFVFVLFLYYSDAIISLLNYNYRNLDLLYIYLLEIV